MGLFDFFKPSKEKVLKESVDEYIFLILPDVSLAVLIPNTIITPLIPVSKWHSLNQC